MAKRSEGRVALITGGARGIGEATAERLAEDGAAIAIGDLDGAGAEATAARIAARHGVKTLGLKVDVSVGAQVNDTVGQIVERLGSLDILVNNAGITRDNLIHKMTDEDWDLVTAVHLKGAFLCSRAAQHEMVKRNWAASSTCPRSPPSAIAARPTIRPPRPGCKAWRAPWRSSSAATGSRSTRSPPALSTPR
jgi:3-oxoacyl-[acyl-carrier protein] reductase